MSTTCAVPRRRKPEGDRGRLYPRLNVEIYPDEAGMVRQARMHAYVRGESLRDLVLRAVAREVERLDREHEGA